MSSICNEGGRIQVPDKGGEKTPDETVEQAQFYLVPTSQPPLSNQSIRCWRINHTTPLDFLGHLYGEVRMELLRRSTRIRVL